ncbi:DUF4350 domain-containing protein [Persicimonas caeni]|uniref:DUF4350 domain-containing protein n=1 Tax=Persicimonas caeni TaxID=2292766 RepID=A0A4Y6Q1N8_PERCE|nr:DUF4350 domain-containing protein [Persicimonas caeni]QDG54350.1 DUF4350 domain-containing protein [Persicimonas caeni]QED35571.1 DUF4350 domain-containing protein [Persicimonas caeni]
MTSRLRQLVWAVLVVCLVTAASTVVAQESPGGKDFDPASDAWTGLSRLVALAEKQGITIEVVDQIDWSEQSPDEPIIFVYPTSGLEIANAANYVVDGGRLFMADDYGASPAFLDRLDVSRVNVAMGELPHDRFVQGNRALPIFEPTGRHPLLEGVDTVVANHPAVLLNVGGPVVSYDEGGGLVYDMNLGDGKVVLFADASLVINHMLSVADNSVLVQNALDYICTGQEQCRAKLIVRDFEQYGRYTPRQPDDDSPDTLSAQLDELNEAISEFMEEMPAGRLLYYLSILLAGGLALYLAAVFRLRASRPYSEYVDNTTREVPSPQSEFDWNLSRFGDGGRETNYALPLAILKEVFEELFLEDLGYWPISGENRPSVEKLGREFGRKYTQGHLPTEAQRMEQEVTDLLATYARIPTRHRVFLDSDAYFSERDLIKIYRRTRRVLEIMGLEGEYERRTRSLV